MNLHWTQMQFDPSPNDPNGVVWYVSLEDEQRVELSDNRGNKLHPIPLKVFKQMVLQLGCWETPEVLPIAEEEEIPF